MAAVEDQPPPHRIVRKARVDLHPADLVTCVTVRRRMAGASVKRSAKAKVPGPRYRGEKGGRDSPVVKRNGLSWPFTIRAPPLGVVSCVTTSPRPLTASEPLLSQATSAACAVRRT